MNSKVNIIADDKGNVVRQSNSNSEFGHVRLVQTRVTFGNSGWVKKSNISTLLHGKLEDLQEMGLESMEFLPGKIIIKEQLEAFSANNGDRDYKIAGETGIICALDGQPIYRKTFFVADATAQDVLVAHNNGAAIKEANGLENNTSFESNKETEAITAEEFGFDDSEEGDELVSETADEVVEEEVNETFEL